MTAVRQRVSLYLPIFLLSLTPLLPEPLFFDLAIPVLIYLISDQKSFIYIVLGRIRQVWRTPKPLYQVWAMPAPGFWGVFRGGHEYQKDPHVSWAITGAALAVGNPIPDELQPNATRRRGGDDVRDEVDHRGHALYVAPDRGRLWNIFFGLYFFLVYGLMYDSWLWGFGTFIAIWMFLPLILFYFFRVPVLANQLKIPRTPRHATWFAALVTPRRLWAKRESPAEIRRTAYYIPLRNRYQLIARLFWHVLWPFEARRMHMSRWDERPNAATSLAKMATMDLFSPTSRRAFLDGGMLRWVAFFWMPIWASLVSVTGFLMTDTWRCPAPPPCPQLCAAEPPAPCNFAAALFPEAAIIAPGAFWLIIASIFAVVELRRLTDDLSITEKERDRQPFWFGDPRNRQAGAVKNIESGWAQRVIAALYGFFTIVYLVLAQIIK